MAEITIPQPPPGVVTLVVCDEDGLKAWVSMNEHVLLADPDFPALMAALRDAQEQVRQTGRVRKDED